MLRSLTVGVTVVGAGAAIQGTEEVCGNGTGSGMATANMALATTRLLRSFMMTA